VPLSSSIASDTPAEDWGKCAVALGGLMLLPVGRVDTDHVELCARRPRACEFRPDCLCRDAPSRARRAVNSASWNLLRWKNLGWSGLALAALASPAVAQQYYYQPSPGYYQNDTAVGAVTGGGLGAITGAIVGGKKNREGGALIGAGVGALTGGLIGKSVDNADQQRTAVGIAATQQANAQLAAAAVTNFDLVEMTRAGVSEELIISTIRNRGGRFDLSPNQLIALKQHGVSDRVVLAAQEMSSGGFAPPAYATAAPAPVIVGPPVYYVRPAPVYYRPAPAIHFDFGYGGGHYHHGHHGGHWGHHGHW
jgi:hypothetical protein